MNKTQNLIENLRLSELSVDRSQKAKSARPTKSSVSREKAEIKYKDLTNLTKY